MPDRPCDERLTSRSRVRHPSSLPPGATSLYKSRSHPGPSAAHRWGEDVIDPCWRRKKENAIEMAIEPRRMTYSVDEAAAILGVSKSKIYDSVRSGELRGVQVGRRVVIPCETLKELLGSLSVGQHG